MGTPTSVTRPLPWQKYAGKSKGEGGMKKELSPGLLTSIVGGIFLCISIWGLCILRFSGDFGDRSNADWSLVWGVAIVISALLLVGGFFWHRRDHGGGDSYPDVLGQLFPHAHLAEAEAVHLAVFAFQHGPFCRVVVVAQNRFSLATKLHVHFTGDVDASLHTEVPGAGMVMAWRDQTLGEAGGHFKTTFDVSAGASGTSVRNVRRNLLGKHTAQQVARLLIHGGIAGALMDATAGPRGNKPMEIIFADVAGKLPIQLYPAHEAPDGDVNEVTPDWQSITLWDPRSSRDIAQASATLRRVFGSVPVKYTWPFKWGISADSIHALHRG